MEEKKRLLWNGKPLSLLVKITLITFLIHPKTVSASEVALKTTGIPVPICFFLLLNVLQFSVATVMILEVKKKSVSKVWNTIHMANFASMFEPLVLALILSKQYVVLATNILVSIALSYTAAVFMVNVTI